MVKKKEKNTEKKDKSKKIKKINKGINKENNGKKEKGSIREDIKQQIKVVEKKLKDPKMKEEFKKIVQRTEKGLKTFGSKILELAEIVKEDTVYGAKIGKLKLKVMDLESKRMKKLRMLGETVYKLVQEENLDDPKVTELYNQILVIEKDIRGYQAEIKKTSGKFKKVNF